MPKWVLRFNKENNIMLSESQNIEYKESWRDEYLKWICGFENHVSGTLITIYRNVGVNGTNDTNNVGNMSETCRKQTLLNVNDLSCPPSKPIH